MPFVGVTRGFVELLESVAVSGEGSGPVWCGIGGFHPGCNVFFEYFINEGFDGDFDVVFCLEDVNAVVHVQIPLLLDGMVSFLLMRSMTMSDVWALGAAIAKLSTCCINNTRLLSKVPEYRQGSWTMGVSPISRNILSACFSHNLGDSG